MSTGRAPILRCRVGSGLGLPCILWGPGPCSRVSCGVGTPRSRGHCPRTPGVAFPPFPCLPPGLAAGLGTARGRGSRGAFPAPRAAPRGTGGGSPAGGRPRSRPARHPCPPAPAPAVRAAPPSPQRPGWDWGGRGGGQARAAASGGARWAGAPGSFAWAPVSRPRGRARLSPGGGAGRPESAPACTCTSPNSAGERTRSPQADPGGSWAARGRISNSAMGESCGAGSALRVATASPGATGTTLPSLLVGQGRGSRRIPGQNSLRPESWGLPVTLK